MVPLLVMVLESPSTTMPTASSAEKDAATVIDRAERAVIGDGRRLRRPPLMVPEWVIRARSPCAEMPAALSPTLITPLLVIRRIVAEHVDWRRRKQSR